MLFKRKELPNINDFVICTVKNILHHSVFVNLDEYENIEGLIHISEIAPGRIRNIRDYVKPEKMIVCKVLKVNTINRQVDLSLRRVSVNAMKIKLDQYRQEERAEKLLENAGKQCDVSLEKAYNEVGMKIIENFGSLHEGFNNIALTKDNFLDKLNGNEKFINTLKKLIKEKIKLPKFKVKIILELRNYEENGVALIKDLIYKFTENSRKKGQEIKFSYISAPKYYLELVTSDKKSGESIAEGIAEEVINEAKKNKIVGKWEKAS